MFYTVYKITNILNGKYYIGKHQTSNLDDGYMGSGKYLWQDITKYGIEYFKKEILFIFDNEEEMNAKEREIVVISEETYNLCDGGQGGFGYININNLCDKSAAGKLGRKKSDKKLEELYGPEWRKVLGEKAGKASAIAYKKLTVTDPLFAAKIKSGGIKGRLAALSDESKAKRRETLAKIGHQQGVKNSQFGTCWITNGIEDKKIKKETINSYIELGYTKGRKS